MTKPIVRDPMYRQCAFDADIIELCVRWYITYRLSYRDLMIMMTANNVSRTSVGLLGPPQSSDFRKRRILSVNIPTPSKAKADRSGQSASTPTPLRNSARMMTRK